MKDKKTIFTFPFRQLEGKHAQMIRGGHCEEEPNEAIDGDSGGPLV